jgi:hypothetical protein
MEESLEQRIQKIEERNRYVEQNKSWETSWVRRLCISVLTYLVVLAYSWWIGTARPWIHALVPVMGFLLSTLTISTIKKHWIQRRLHSTKYRF